MTDLSNTELRLQLLEQKYLSLTMKTDVLLKASNELLEGQRAMQQWIVLQIMKAGLTCTDENCECKKKTNNGEQNTTTNNGSSESTNETTKDNAQTNESSSGTKTE